MSGISDLLLKIAAFCSLAAEQTALPFNPKLPYKRVWGPYLRRNTPTDLRSIVVVELEDGSRRTMSAPKYKYECYTGQKLRPEDTINHKDRNETNDAFDNLEVRDRAEHSALDTRRVKMLTLKCCECGKEFERSPRMLRDKSKKGRSGPFCSKSCGARNARKVQLGLVERSPIQQHTPSEYYRRKIEQHAANMAVKWNLTKIGSHLSPEDEEIALSEVDEMRDTVPIELWRKYKHREISGVQWKPKEEPKKPEKKAMNTRFMGGSEPPFLDEIDVELIQQPKPLDSSAFDELPDDGERISKQVVFRMLDDAGVSRITFMWKFGDHDDYSAADVNAWLGY